jgi:transglutaminase-like putative cysteine protease
VKEGIYVQYQFGVTSRYTTLSPGGATVSSWVSLYNNRTTGPEETNVRLQESRLVARNIAPVNYFSTHPADVHNNTYDYFNSTLTSGSNSLTINYNWTATLREYTWTTAEVEVPTYDPSDPLVAQYTQATPYCESDDAEIIALSNEICAGISHPISRAKAIYVWVVENLEYEVQSRLKGAKGVLKDMVGDCSEYSCLMVALLRVQGIPARKVLGVAIATGSIDALQPILQPKNQSSWAYNATNLPAHAWLEYYVPSIGWITCDPTWGAGGLYYFNYVDTCHLAIAVGDDFYDGIEPPLPERVAEFGIPYLFYHSSTNFQYTFGMHFKILATDYVTNTNPIIGLALLGSTGFLCLLGLSYALRSGRRRRDY